MMIDEKRVGFSHRVVSPRASSLTDDGSLSSKRPSPSRMKRSSRKKTDTILMGFTVATGLLFVAVLATLKLIPSSTLTDLPPASHRVHSDANDRERRNESRSNQVEVPTVDEEELSLLEARILKQARKQLDRFPISIGSDNGSNDDWEVIVHPGTEALKYLHGESFTPAKRASASDVASILMGKRLKPSNDDDNGLMRVPKFWDPEPFQTIADMRDKHTHSPNIFTSTNDGVRRYLGNYGSRLMTPQEAKSIGSHITTPSGITLETIFVTIASYRDWQCSSTVESAYSRASHPERIRVGVVDQIHDQDIPCSIPPKGPCDQFPDQATCQHSSQIDYLTVDSGLSVGPVFARHLGHRLYRGEFFAMQSDAHITFVRGWDDEIIQQWHSARSEMAVLSTYLSSVEDHIHMETGERISKSRPIMCESDYEGVGRNKHLRHGQQPEGIPYIHDMPTLNPFWAAGFSFGRGHFVVNVPYDQHLPWIFQGEEISMGLRGFSYGYDYYAAEKSPCYHHYGRSGIPMFWENVDTYRGSGELGMTRLNAIIHMLPSGASGNEWIRTDELKYGIGKVRDLQRFFDTFGIHVETQSVEHHLCQFVGRPMQAEFIPYLRSNGMGLDYSKIKYRYVDGG